MIISIPFFLTLFISFSLYWLIPRQSYRIFFLSAISLAFIAYLDYHASIVVFCLSVYAYAFSYMVVHGKYRQARLTIGISGLVAILLLFKYLGLLEKTLNDLDSFLGILPVFKIEKIFLPLGLSYIIFKYISYLTDVYWGITKRGTFIELLCYGSLFTIFVAGPIDRFERLQPQFRERTPFSASYAGEGFERIVFGIFKKVVLADWIGYFINPVFHSPGDYSGHIWGLALIGYSFQIYFDFSGYSDIAIGSSRFFGLRIMENFNWPYLQPNISQFWRCWHISLSDWIRDYLFFPLSRVSSNKVWIMLFVPVIAMGLCGFWHGARWHFLVWGIIHGLGIAGLQVWNLIKKKKPSLAAISKTGWFNVFSIILTFAFVTFAWIWFM